MCCQIAEHKPAVYPRPAILTKECRRCGATFVTSARIRKRCDTCQAVVSTEKKKKANERLKVRRAALRLAQIKIKADTAAV
jgi:hypothetical protein